MSAPRPGRWLRLLAGATALATATVVAMPAVWAAYTGTYTPSEAVTAHPLVQPTLTCAGGSAVNLTWSDSDATTPDPYTSGAFYISSYVLEYSTSNGTSWSTFSTPTRTTTTAVDSNFGILGLGNQILYRIRSTQSTNWVSSNSNTITATVTVVLFITNVSC